MLEYLQTIYSSTFNPSKFDWNLFFDLRRTGELFSTEFYNYATTQTGIGEFRNDSVGKKCVPSTDKQKNQDDFEHHNAFWYTLCNFTVNDSGLKIPTALKGQSTFKMTGEVDVAVLTPPLYWGEEKTDNGYIKHFSDSEHPSGHPGLTLTLMPHCRDNKGNPMPYGIVPVYYAGEIDGKMYGSSGLAVKNFTSYTSLQTAVQKKGTGWQGSGSERSAYLRNFLWIKYRTLNSQSIFQGCTNWNIQVQAKEATTAQSYIVLSSADAAKFYVGCTVSIGDFSANNNDRGQATMRNLADLVRVTKIEACGSDKSKVYVDGGKTFSTVASKTYISSMPLHSGQTDNVLGKDGYVANDGKHSFRIQGVEEGIGAYFVSANEILDKTTATHTDLYNKNFKNYSVDKTYINGNWKKIAGFDSASSADLWIGEEVTDLETGSSYVKTAGSGDSVGTGDRYYYGGSGIGLRERLDRGSLWPGVFAGLSYVYGGFGVSTGYWFFAGCVS